VTAVDALTLRQWLLSLDALSYYDLFRVTPEASFDEVRSAFHVFAGDFHPDVHGFRPPAERAAIATIFRRGTEAYRVLSDPHLRARYDEALATGVRRPASVTDLEAPRSSLTPRASSRPSDQLRNPAARPFVLRAEELRNRGDPKQAKIQLVMAMHLDPSNPILEVFARELDAEIARRADDDKRRWHKE
jgi:curved DNA-binding protein CbpA